MFKCIDFSLKMRSPLKESISCFLIRLSPLVLVPIGLFHRAQSPHLCRAQSPLLYRTQSPHLIFYRTQSPHLIFFRTQSPRFYAFIELKVLAFVGLKILTFIFHWTQSPRLYLSHDSKSSLAFIGLRVLYFYLSPLSCMLLETIIVSVCLPETIKFVGT